MAVTAGRRSRSSTTLRVRLRRALGVLSLVLLLTGVGLVVVLRRADHALTEQAQRTFPARVAASRLLTALVDQETGLRGYALTGDARFLGPYRQGLVDEQQSRSALDRYVRPGEPGRLALLTVDAAITAWRDQYASLRISGSPTAGADSTIEFGRQLFERVRSANAALDAELRTQAQDAQRQVDRDRGLVVAALAAMAVIVAAAVIALERALRTSVLLPLQRLSDQVAVVSGGRHERPIEADGPPDIQAMGAGVESMRVELVGALDEVRDQRLDLERRSLELARSNADLEQFAYVASHDLQEPLRKVASFCHLLQQRYGGQLDERADQYIAFAVDGATRMQRLISDLLTFSRVGRTSEGFVRLDLRIVVQEAWDSLERRAVETGGTLEVEVDDDGARHVLGDPSLVRTLFVNLLGNSLKYRRPDRAPVVHVKMSLDGTTTRVEVDDNGIGIPDEYADKVFVIFQRLHGRDEYEGTGIGLALAKKIVEFHGGSIRLVPSTLGGACVSFTLPIQQEAVAHV